MVFKEPQWLKQNKKKHAMVQKTNNLFYRAIYLGIGIQIYFILHN